MLTVTIANFTAIILAASGRLFRKEKAMLLVATILLTLFYSIRTDYGNDIPAYMRLFDNISESSFSNIFDINDRIEPGWLVLNYIFVPLGWQAFITFLTIIQFGTFYWLVNKYSIPKQFWIVLAMYILFPYMMLVSLSMLRQALAMSIIAWAIPSILNKRLLIPLILIFLTSTIHTSAYVALLLIALPYISGLRKQFLVISFICIFVCLFIAESLVGDILNIFLESETFERYSGYADGEQNLGSGLGVLLFVICVIWLFLWHNDSSIHTFFILVYAIYVVLIPFVYNIPLVGRISCYFQLYSLVALPLLILRKGDFIGKFIFTVMIYIIISSYFNFFESPVWHDAYSTYYTIFN